MKLIVFILIGIQFCYGDIRVDNYMEGYEPDGYKFHKLTFPLNQMQSDGEYFLQGRGEHSKCFDYTSSSLIKCEEAEPGTYFCKGWPRNDYICNCADTSFGRLKCFNDSVPDSCILIMEIVVMNPDYDELMYRWNRYISGKVGSFAGIVIFAIIPLIIFTLIFVIANILITLITGLWYGSLLFLNILRLEYLL